jgi:hypothetical protein
MPDDPGADGLAVPGDDVQDPGRDRVRCQLHEAEHGERRLLRRLQDGDVPRRERRRELPDRHHERVVPRRDLADDPERLPPDPRGVAAHVLAGRAAFEDARRAGEEADVVRADRHLVARVRQRLAHVLRLDPGQLLAVLVQQVGQLEQHLGALAGCRLAPLRPRLPGGLDRAVDVRLRPLRHRGDRFTGGGVQDLGGLALDGVDPLAADKVLVARNRNAHREPPCDRCGESTPVS